VKRHSKWWRIAAYVAGAALVIYLVVGVIIAGFGTPPLPPDQTGITLKGGKVEGHRITTRSWSFDYQSAQLSPDGSTGTVEGVRDGVVFKHGKPYLRVSAERITIDTLSLNFTAIGKVTVTMIGDPQKRSFDTDLIMWTNQTKLLTMEHPSYLHTDGQTLAFSSIEIDFNTDRVHFGSIRGSMEVRK
jgi:hypothetical protein